MSASKYKINPDALLQIREDTWIFSNPRTKTHVAISEVKNITESFNAAQWREILSEVVGSDCTQVFFGENGLHCDHTGFLKNPNNVSGENLFELLCKRWILVEEDLTQYRDFLGQLTSTLDRSHLGSFHQRVGQYLTIEKRIGAERWRWWHNQKFTEDGKALKPGPYREIQEYFFDQYFEADRLSGLKVLDFGCGNGYYSAKLARLGAKVTGVDTSAELIELAKNNYADRANFILVEPNPEELKNKLHEKFDLIFMQDVLLILMKPENGKAFEDLSPLLSVLRSCLKENGKLYTMEPNATFWLAGRYGDKNNPYAIVTEYQRQVFNVVPLFTEIVNLMGQHGFALLEYQHPSSRLNDLYANNFCIWDFMCFLAV